MTCIVAIETPHGAVLAADTLGSNTWVGLPLDRPKIVTNAGILFGVSGTMRLLDLLEYAVTVPPYQAPEVADRKFLVTEVVPLIRKAAKDADALFLRDGIAGLAGSALLAYRGHIYELQSDLSILAPAPVAPGVRILVTGSGGEHAWAALRNDLGAMEGDEHGIVIDREWVGRRLDQDGWAAVAAAAVKVAGERVVSVNGEVQIETQRRPAEQDATP